MISFPVLDKIDITNYGLYPGQKDNVLKISFKPGTTLVLGANGLGKTTLISILYRMLTGPFELPKTSTGSELGGASLEPRKLNSKECGTFAARVHDGAVNATATLTLRFGDRRVLIKRKLKNLSLFHFSIDDEAIPADEEKFQEKVCGLAGVWGFGDWLLMLNHLVFYFEDRRALVWDPSAQRQLFRFLFLPIDKAAKWYKNERAILRLDSEARNDSAALFRLQNALIANAEKYNGLGDVKAELESLERIKANETERIEYLVEQTSALDAQRNSLRLELLQSDQKREDIVREFERAKLIAIQSHFPSGNETGQYLLAQFIVDGKCIACSSSAKKTAESISSRLDAGQCVVCGSDISIKGAPARTVALDHKRIEQRKNDAERINSRLRGLEREIVDINNEFSKLGQEIAELSVQRDERNTRIAVLLSALPKDDSKVREQKRELSQLKQVVSEKSARVNALGVEFERFAQSVVRDIQMRSHEVKTTFHEYAEEFLLEKCELKWSPHENKIGQLGVKVEFPAFELAMSGVDFIVAKRRDKPDQVSESQREFIDLAFRMALMSVAGNHHGGSLIIDAPESSLDAIFVEQAADVLARFGAFDSKNRLIIASNLVQGNLIPEILKKVCPADESSERLVNLLKLAVPTAALREKRSEYEKILKDLLERGGLKYEP